MTREMLLNSLEWTKKGIYGFNWAGLAYFSMAHWEKNKPVLVSSVGTFLLYFLWWIINSWLIFADLYISPGVVVFLENAPILDKIKIE